MTSAYFSVARPGSVTDVVCVGRAGRLRRLPGVLGVRAYRCRAAAWWVPHIQLAIVLLNDTFDTVDMVIHELCHGLLSHWTCGFPYPWALEEGLALLVGRRITGHCLSQRRSQACDSHRANDHARASQDLIMTVCDQICARTSTQELPAPGDWRSRYYRPAYSALWLAAFLESSRWNGVQALRLVLECLRQHDARTPKAAYQQIACARGSSAGELEGAFQAYCFQGITDVRGGGDARVSHSASVGPGNACNTRETGLTEWG